MAYLLALLGAWFGFANPVLQIPPLVALLPCALIWLGGTAESGGQAFRRGWLAALLAYAACLYWVVVPVQVYGPLPWILALPCPVLLGAVLALFAAVFTLLIFWVDRRLPWYLGGPFAGAAWATLELARAKLLTGFPWLSLPQALAPWPLALQALSVMGVFCFSGLLVLICAWVVHGLQRALPLVAACALLGAVYAFGASQVDRPNGETEGFSASVVQGNIDQNRKWDRAFQNATISTYLALSRQAIEEHDPDLLLWPETALPFYLQEDTPYRARIEAFVRQAGRPLLTGAPGYSYLERGDAGQGELTMFNRAYLLDAQGRIVDVYEKEHLVPFGEYVPLKRFLPFLDSLVPGEMDFSPGRRTAPLESGSLALGALICYEVIFPDLAQKRVQNGAAALVNLSNDAWFGRTSAPKQHLHQAVLRALEQRRYVLRTTNTGISAVIDARGRILDRTPLFEEATLYWPEIELLTERTFFSKHFGVVNGLPPVLAAALFLFALLRSDGSRKGQQRPRFRRGRATKPSIG